MQESDNGRKQRNATDEGRLNNIPFSFEKIQAHIDFIVPPTCLLTLPLAIQRKIDLVRVLEFRGKDVRLE